MRDDISTVSNSGLPTQSRAGDGKEALSLDRRGLLKMGSAAVALATGTAAMQGTTAATSRKGISFDRVLHAVDDLDLDPNGNDPIDDSLESAFTDGALVEFPAGQYRVTREITVDSSSGILGLGDTRDDVWFLPDTGLRSVWLRFSTPNGFLVENVTLDRRADYETSIGMMGNVQHNLQIHDVEYSGWTPSGPQMLVCNVLDSDGQLVADGFYRVGPTRFEQYPESSLDIYIGTDSRATHTLRNLEIHNGSESGVYAGKAPGPVRVEDSYFKNCVHTAVRIAGENSSVKRTTVIMDTDDWDPRNEVDESTYDGDPRIQLNRGIWTQTNDFEKTGPLVEDCDVVVRNCPGGLAGIFNAGDCGGLRLQNTRVHCDEDDVIPVLIDEEWNHDVMASPYYAQFDGVSVTGTCAGHPGILVKGRDGTEIQNCCIEMPNTDGIVFEGTQDGLVKDCNISVGREATVFKDAQVEVVNLGAAESCPLPSSGSRPSTGSNDSNTTSDSTDGTTSDSTDSTGSTDTSSSRFEIQSVENGPLFHYQFTTSGQVTRVKDGSENDAEDTDVIVDNGDGTYTVSGMCGDGYGDAFDLAVPSFSEFTTDTTADAFYLLLDGTRLTVDELLGGNGDSSSETTTDGSSDGTVTGDNFLFTRRTELDAIVDRATGGREPWASAWKKVESSATVALNVSLKAVTDDNGSHYFELDSNDRHDYREAIRTGDRVRNLALAHFVTGEDRYAEKAIDQIHHWFLNDDTYQYPAGSGDYGVEQYLTIPKFLMGAAPLRGHPYWDTKSATSPWNGGSAASAEDALAEWAVTWANNLTEPNYNTIWIWLAVAEASAGVYAGDDALFESAVNRYKSEPAWNDFNDDGSFQAALDKSNGFRNQLFRMKAHATFCEIARHRGRDLYSHNALKESFDWMANYVLNPDDWEWGTGSLDFDLSHQAPGLYELAYSVWKEPVYFDAVQQAGRPVDGGHLLQWVTFTHGNLFDLANNTASLPHTIYVDGTGTTSEYQFTVTEDAIKISADSTDTVSGTTIEGTVTDEQDVFDFAGRVTEMHLDGDIEISFDSSSG